jgi:hypothetical protein
MQYNDDRMELNYEIRERAPKEVRFESEGGRHTLTFPLSPAWLIFVSAGSVFAPMVMHLALLGQAFFMLRPTLAVHPMFFFPLFVFLVLSLGWGVTGWWILHSYRRSGHIPRCVWVDEGRRVLGYRAERTNRSQEWKLSSIRKLRVKKIKALWGIGAGCLVSIRLNGRLSPLGFRYRQSEYETLHSFVSRLIELVPQADVQQDAP